MNTAEVKSLLNNPPSDKQRVAKRRDVDLMKEGSRRSGRRRRHSGCWFWTLFSREGFLKDRLSQTHRCHPHPTQPPTCEYRNTSAQRRAWEAAADWSSGEKKNCICRNTTTTVRLLSSCGARKLYNVGFSRLTGEITVCAPWFEAHTAQREGTWHLRCTRECSASVSGWEHTSRDARQQVDVSMMLLWQQRPVAPPNDAAFLFFKCNIFASMAEIHTSGGEYSDGVSSYYRLSSLLFAFLFLSVLLYYCLIIFLVFFFWGGGL